MNWADVRREQIEAAELTETQRIVVRLTAAGVSQREIARSLKLSRSTIRGHLEHAAHRIRKEAA